MRSGTLAPALVVGLGEACSIAKAEMYNDEAHIAKMSDKFLRSTAISLFEVTEYFHSEGLMHKTPLDLNSFGVNENGEVRI